jgi:Ca-activated chloride channel family protein
LTAAKQAAAGGIRIFTVGVGSEEGSEIPLGPGEFVRDPSGKVVQSRLDAARMSEIAESTGGFYVPLDDNAARQLASDGIAQMQEVEMSASASRRPIERYQWPLAGAIALLVLQALVGERRRRPLAWAATMWLVSASGAWSSGLDDYQAGNYDQARQAFEQRLKMEPDSPPLQLNAGTAAYRLKDFGKASEYFSRAMLAEDPALRAAAEFNLGNTLFRQGEGQEDKGKKITDWKDAIAKYDAALKTRPDYTEAKENKERVEELLKQAEEEQKKDQKNDQKQDQKKDQQQKQDQQQQGGQQEKKDQQSGGQQEKKEDQQQGGQKKDEPSADGGQQQQQNQSGQQDKQDQQQGGQKKDEQQQGGEGQKQEQQQGGQQEEQQQEGEKSDEQKDQGQSGQQDQKEGEGQEKKDEQQQSGQGDEQKDEQSGGQQGEQQKDGGDGEKEQDKEGEGREGGQQPQGGGQGEESEPKDEGSSAGARPEPGKAGDKPAPVPQPSGEKKEGELRGSGGAGSEGGEEREAAGVAEAEEEVEGKMSASQARALLRSLQNEEEQVDLRERRTFQDVSRDW